MTVSARPRTTTTDPITNMPRYQARYRIMTVKKNSTAMQEIATTNSYMLPHGTRCTASPRVTTFSTCAARPTAASVTAARTHRPASLKAGLAEPGAGRPSGAAAAAAGEDAEAAEGPEAGGPGTAEGGCPSLTPGATPGAVPPAALPAAPMPASSGTAAWRACCLPAASLLLGRP